MLKVHFTTFAIGMPVLTSGELSYRMHKTKTDFPYLNSTYLSYNLYVNFGALYRNVPKQTTRVEQKKSKEILIE
jgi:hypothetical protein